MNAGVKKALILEAAVTGGNVGEDSERDGF